jgi:hypothetical protein
MFDNDVNRGDHEKGYIKECICKSNIIQLGLKGAFRRLNKRPKRIRIQLRIRAVFPLKDPGKFLIESWPSTKISKR